MNRPPVQQPPLSMAEQESAALAAEMFDHFSAATTMRQILGLYRNMCDTIGLRAAPINEFYPKLKSRIKTWKAQALWKKFDARASHRVYNKGTACRGTRVLVIGAGPCGLRTAIEAQLLGAKVVVVEKRDRISRNNVLHLWPFLITDLRNLGAKKFYGKFCAGSIDHISIRQLQCILLKVALLLGVEVHEGISFDRVLEPSDECGWRAAVTPEDHAVSHYEFDVLIGADGKRNTLEGFRRKEFRGKLAIAITANFINKRTEAEAKAEEISGVAFIFNQAFFKELYATTGIDLENIVYYKDDTHYFVMTAKKHSLIDKGVITQDYSDPAELLSSANVNRERLLDYAREAAQFSTKYQMPNLESAVNHYGNPDVAMFDFTSMFAAEQSCVAVVRRNYRLLQCLVGDSLLEPFWPTGSGCARGFLSSMDAGYAMKLWANPKNSILAVLAQRESIYRLLAQTTPENLHRDIGSYTLDPATRYPNLNRTAVGVHQVRHMLDSDDKALLDQVFVDTNAIQATLDTPVRRKRRTGDTLPLSAVLLRWIKAQLHGHAFSLELDDASECFTHGQVLCALVNRYRPDLVDLAALKEYNVLQCNALAFDIIENELMIPRVMSAEESLTLEGIDSRQWLTYLEQVCEVFRGEIPHVKHPKLDFADLKDKTSHRTQNFSRHAINKYRIKSPAKELENTVDGTSGAPLAAVGTIGPDDERSRRLRRLYEHGSATPTDGTPSRRSRKRRSHDKFGNASERAQRQQEIAENRNDRQNRRRLMRAQQTQNFYKSLHMLQANTLLRESDSNTPFEDYSIYMYRQSAPEFGDRVKELERKLLYPDRDRGIPSAMPRTAGESDAHFNDRIKSMEHKITARHPGGFGAVEKKPKDLLRAIGRIESNDWNIREIEKKIELSKKTEVCKSREKVPKWSKEQFLQRQTKMSKPLDDQQDEKFKDIDETIRNLDKQLKDGHNLDRGERGKNKVASIAGTFGMKPDVDDGSAAEKIGLQKSNSKATLVFTAPAATDVCHFCKQKVYLMEKISAENLLLHRACLKCHHCHTSLRLGGYAFDRDDPAGRFYCTQHYRLPAKVQRPIPRRSVPRGTSTKTPTAPSTPSANSSTAAPNASTPRSRHADTPDRVAARERREGQTPERIEFENVEALSDGEPSLPIIIDENEWTDRNFGTGTEDSESELSDTDSDDSDSDTETDEYEEAEGSPIDAHTLKLANDWIGQQRYSSNEDDEFYDSSDADAESQTEGEELERARQIRRDEVRLKPLPYLPTDTETEKVCKPIATKPFEAQQLPDVTLKSVPPVPPVRRDSINIAANTTEIKFLDNAADRKYSADVDALNESLYKINRFMRLTKDIDEMRKEQSVRQDIQRKLTLKEQWLKNSQPESPNAFASRGSSLYGSAQSVNSLGSRTSSLHSASAAAVPMKSFDNNTIHASDAKVASLTIGTNAEQAPLTRVPAKFTSNIQQQCIEAELFGTADCGKIANVNETETQTNDNDDELQFLDDLELNDNEIKELTTPLSEISSIDKRRRLEKREKERLDRTLKKIELQSFSDTFNHIQSQFSGPKVTTGLSVQQRDLSKFFPKKEEQKPSGCVNKNQTELKNVDLSKYFAPSPVQQRKSFTNATGMIPKLRPQHSDGKPPKLSANARSKTLDMADSQLDGAIDLCVNVRPLRRPENFAKTTGFLKAQAAGGRKEVAKRRNNTTETASFIGTRPVDVNKSTKLRRNSIKTTQNPTQESTSSVKDRRSSKSIQKSQANILNFDQIAQDIDDSIGSGPILNNDSASLASGGALSLFDRLAQSIDICSASNIERSETQQFNCLFHKDDTPMTSQDIELMFDEVAASAGVICESSPPTIVTKPAECLPLRAKTVNAKILQKYFNNPISAASQQRTVTRNDDNIPAKNLTYSKPAPVWCKKPPKPQLWNEDVEMRMMAAMPSTLQQQIRELEAQIALTDPLAILDDFDIDLEPNNVIVDLLNGNGGEKTRPVTSVVVRQKKNSSKAPATGTKKTQNNPDVVVDATTKKTVKKVIQKKKVPAAGKSLRKASLEGQPTKDVSKKPTPNNATKAKSHIPKLSIPSESMMLNDNSISYITKSDMKSTLADAPNEGMPNGGNVRPTSKKSPFSDIPPEGPNTGEELVANLIPVSPSKPTRRQKSNVSSPNASPRIERQEPDQRTLSMSSPGGLSSPIDYSKSDNRPLVELFHSTKALDISSSESAHLDDSNALKNVEPETAVAMKPKPIETKVLFKYKPLSSVGRHVIECPLYPQITPGPRSQRAEISHATDNSSIDLMQMSSGELSQKISLPDLTASDTSAVLKAPAARTACNDSSVSSMPNTREPSPTRVYDLHKFDADPVRPTRRPPQRQSKDDDDITAALLERSQAIHNKKQDFMQEKLSSTNPYMRQLKSATQSRESLLSDGSSDGHRPPGKIDSFQSALGSGDFGANSYGYRSAVSSLTSNTAKPSYIPDEYRAARAGVSTYHIEDYHRGKPTTSASGYVPSVVRSTIRRTSPPLTKPDSTLSSGTMRSFRNDSLAGNRLGAYATSSTSSFSARPSSAMPSATSYTSCRPSGSMSARSTDYGKNSASGTSRFNIFKMASPLPSRKSTSSARRESGSRSSASGSKRRDGCVIS